jgi:antagonist of KipI
MTLDVLAADGLVTVQDLGRPSWRRCGVPLSGPMDPFALRAANLLAGNLPRAACLEVGMGEAVFRPQQDCLIAAAGAGFSLSVYMWTFPLWSAFRVRGGWTVRLEKTDGGSWVYLAVAGGLDLPVVLGSRATYLPGTLGGLDGRRLRPGDLLPTGRPACPPDRLAARRLPPEHRPLYSSHPTVEVIPGPQTGCFSEQDLQTLLSAEYMVSASSDRMGYRLEGPPLARLGPAELVSEGMPVGAVQVPAGGQPLVMMADGPTTGGYPKIACVASADLPLLAQCPPGSGRVRFRQTTVQAAQARYRRLLDGLENGIVQEQDDTALAQ